MAVGLLGPNGVPVLPVVVLAQNLAAEVVRTQRRNTEEWLVEEKVVTRQDVPSSRVQVSKMFIIRSTFSIFLISLSLSFSKCSFLQYSEYFFFLILVDGRWTSWSEWTTCSVSCGTGTKSRDRSCSSPEPKHGGMKCKGESDEKTQCMIKPCKS